MKPEAAPANANLTNLGAASTTEAQAIFSRVFRAVRPRTTRPQIEVRFAPFANANSFIQLKHGRMEVRIADVLQSAPPPVLEALAQLLIHKLYRKPVPPISEATYRRYLATKAMRITLANLRQERGRKQIAAPQGKHFDLVELFEKVNLEYFHGLMSRPNLGWSQRASRVTLGHYDAAHHTIVINRTLDTPSTPSFVVEFVLYHEMLHVKFPAEQRGTKRCIHTPEFQRAERMFARYEEVHRFLRG